VTVPVQGQHLKCLAKYNMSDREIKVDCTHIYLQIKTDCTYIPVGFFSPRTTTSPAPADTSPLTTVSVDSHVNSGAADCVCGLE
jgi:hypothetical protein